MIYLKNQEVLQSLKIDGYKNYKSLSELFLQILLSASLFCAHQLYIAMYNNGATSTTRTVAKDKSDIEETDSIKERNDSINIEIENNK